MIALTQLLVVAVWMAGAASGKITTTVSPTSSVASHVPTAVGFDNSTGPNGIGAYSQYGNATEDDTVLSSDSFGIVSKATKPGYSVVELLNYADVMYTAQLLIGSTGQKVQVQVDTGSTDLWVATPDKCPDSASWCEVQGHYDPSKSTTAKSQKKTFHDGYGGGTNVNNTWYTDDVTLGDMTFKKFSFGVTNTTTSDVVQGGIMGLNYYQSSKTVLSKFQKVSGAKKQGFGIYLGTPGDGQKGNLVFGGIDYAKIDGNLTAINTIDSTSLKSSKQTTWSFLVTGTKYGNDDMTTTASSALLDVGCTNLGLATEAFQNLVKKLDATNKDGKWTFKCPSNPDDLKFQFQGVAISVPLDTLYSKDGDTCTLTSVVDMGIKNYQLGIYFLRYAYVYFDANKKTALIGKSKFTNDTNVAAFTKDVTVSTKANAQPVQWIPTGGMQVL